MASAGSTTRPAPRPISVWHNGAIDSYRADLRLRTASGVGVVVLSNFGNANTEAFADRVLAALDATGAMKPREPADHERVHGP